MTDKKNNNKLSDRIRKAYENVIRRYGKTLERLAKGDERPPTTK
jgi:hypothetical protein